MRKNYNGKQNRKDLQSSVSPLSVEAFRTLNFLFEILENAGVDAECDGYSLAIDLPDGRHYLF